MAFSILEVAPEAPCTTIEEVRLAARLRGASARERTVRHLQNPADGGAVRPRGSCAGGSVRHAALLCPSGF